MWYPEWFGSFENWMLSVLCSLVLVCFLRLVRIHEALNDIEKRLRDASKRNEGERDV